MEWHSLMLGVPASSAPSVFVLLCDAELFAQVKEALDYANTQLTAAQERLAKLDEEILQAGSTSEEAISQLRKLLDKKRQKCIGLAQQMTESANREAQLEQQVSEAQVCAPPQMGIVCQML